MVSWYKKTLTALCVVSITLLTAHSVSVRGEETITTKGLIDLFIKNDTQQTQELSDDYEKAKKEFEIEKEKLMNDEIYNSFYDSAEAYQEARKEEIGESIDALLMENSDLVAQIEANILGDFSILQRCKSQYDINLSKIDGLLESANRFVLSDRRQLDISKLESIRQQMDNVTKDESSLHIGSESVTDSILLGARTDLRYPVVNATSISSGYGDRVDRITGTTLEFNAGLDFDASAGTEVVSLFNGKVISTGFSAVTGNYVTINHGGGIVMIYSHLQAVNVSAGSSVKQYDTIGTVGNSGYTNGKSFLHVGLYLNGVPMDLGVLYE